MHSIISIYFISKREFSYTASVYSLPAAQLLNGWCFKGLPSHLRHWSDAFIQSELHLFFQHCSENQCQLMTQSENIPGCVFRKLDQLADALTDTTTTTIPISFEVTTILPVPKKSSVSCLDDYRPVALTPIIIKSCQEACHEAQITHWSPCSLSIILPMLWYHHHQAFSQLDKKDTYSTWEFWSQTSV